MLDRLQGVFRCFEEHDVSYLVIGGIASILHGVPRATLDMDILIQATPGNAGRLLEALTEAGLGSAALTTAEDLLAHEITIFQDRVRIDVLTSAPGLQFADAWARREMTEFRGQLFPVVSRSDLIASKRASGRPVDLEDVRMLELPEDDGG